MTLCKDKKDKSASYDCSVGKIADFINSSDFLNKDKLYIKFWGGEPLIYLPQIKDIISALNNDSGRFDFIIISNGSLLDSETVQFLNRYGIWFKLSNDGHCSSITRQRNILEEENFLALFRGIKTKGINMVWNAYNQDLYTAWDYFESVLGTDISVSTEILHNYAGMPGDLCNFDLDVVRESINQVMNKIAAFGLNSDKAKKEHFLIRPTLTFMLQVELGEIPRYANSCGIMQNRLSIDSTGQVLLCHSTTDKTGATINDAFPVILAGYLEEHPDYYTHIECVKCGYYKYCRGGCPESSYNYNAPYSEKLCAVRTILYDALIKYINGREENEQAT